MLQINGDILKAKEDYIIHQCNCRSYHSSGLANQIFKVFPEANTYIDSNFKRIPGEISVHGRIINAYAQDYPGKSDKEPRLEWFKKCMYAIVALKPKSIAMPVFIGCGLAGGDWEQYYKVICNIFEPTDIECCLYAYSNES